MTVSMMRVDERGLIGAGTRSIGSCKLPDAVVRIPAAQAVCPLKLER
jgi:hypothetical protein